MTLPSTAATSSTRWRSAKGQYTGPVPASLTQYTLPQDELRDFYKVDIAKAKQLLSAAGFSDGLSFDCPLENVVDMQKFATVVKDQLSKANINMNIVPRELGTYLAQNLYARNFQGTMYYNLPYVEPDRPLCAVVQQGPGRLLLLRLQQPSHGRLGGQGKGRVRQHKTAADHP